MGITRRLWIYRKLSIQFMFALAVSCAAIAFLIVPQASSKRSGPDVASYGRVHVEVHPFDPNVVAGDHFNDIIQPVTAR